MDYSLEKKTLNPFSLFSSTSSSRGCARGHPAAGEAKWPTMARSPRGVAGSARGAAARPQPSAGRRKGARGGAGGARAAAARPPPGAGARGGRGGCSCFVLHPEHTAFLQKKILMLHKCFGVLRHVIYDVATCLILRFGLASSLPDRRPIGGGGGGGDGVSMGRMGGHLWLCLSWYRGGVGGGAAASAGGRRPSASR